jgi:hypothetical protein
MYPNAWLEIHYQILILMFFIGINAEIEKLSDDMHLVAENLV